jgi:hypothetical protein
MSSIFAHPPMVLPSGSSVAVNFRSGDKTVSLALDDSCGRMQVLARGEIALFREGQEEPCTMDEFTDQVIDGTVLLAVPASMENFDRAMQWLNRASWGFSA